MFYHLFWNNSTLLNADEDPTKPMLLHMDIAKALARFL